jgi:hypothetical protein
VGLQSIAGVGLSALGGRGVLCSRLSWRSFTCLRATWKRRAKHGILLTCPKIYKTAVQQSSVLSKLPEHVRTPLQEETRLSIYEQILRKEQEAQHDQPRAATNITETLAQASSRSTWAEVCADPRALGPSAPPPCFVHLSACYSQGFLPSMLHALNAT